MRTCLCDHSAGFAGVVLQSREAEDVVSDSGLSDCFLEIFSSRNRLPAPACSGIISARTLSNSGKAAEAHT